MQPIPASLLTLIAGIVITLISFWVGQHHGLLPEQASEQAPLVDGFFNIMMTIATALFLVVQGAILIFSLKFRQRPGDQTDGVPIEGSISLEILWTAIPAIIVIGLGIYSVDVYERMGGFGTTHAHTMAHHAAPTRIAHHAGSAIAAPLEAATTADVTPVTQLAEDYGIGAMSEKAPDLTVAVSAMQYAWIFNYPDSGITAGELHVPVGQDVKLNISALDVIHAFWVPQFRLKQDAIPGQPTELRFVATKTGTFPIVCTELCGSYHGGMRSQVIVHTPEEYDTWIAENRVAQQQGLNQAIATNPMTQTPTEFLAPYASELGVTATTLAQLHTH